MATVITPDGGFGQFQLSKTGQILDAWSSRDFQGAIHNS